MWVFFDVVLFVVFHERRDPLKCWVSVFLLFVVIFPCSHCCADVFFVVSVDFNSTTPCMLHWNWQGRRCCATRAESFAGVYGCKYLMMICELPVQNTTHTTYTTQYKHMDEYIETVSHKPNHGARVRRGGSAQRATTSLSRFL